MPIFYHTFNERLYFDAPQFNRMRHRYRGVRESAKVNLEIDQTSFSINRLYEKQTVFDDSFVLYAELLTEGGNVGVNDGNNAPIVITGIDELAARIEGVTKRVKALEA